MRARTAVLVAVPVTTAALLLSGCETQPERDRTEISTFTDEHGRACTAAVVTESDDGDQEVQALDCAYPPQGREPGPDSWNPLPR
ncbi:hypothetical protein [Streptomyces radicis]|uniref:Uncharacterized protein n=1 Tax=Streptomyces radicis TaxID=1750517 RepID=A0A3A9VZU2_9ACTN|nr:hypothetical protein [Streptomyces radicis]RKN05713.1 hypothetical protein D7319_24615 [Streptomyces radicis]RKN17553.1 hypothetical protein D7318_23980 [Streptomyces radicis]